MKRYFSMGVAKLVSQLRRRRRCSSRLPTWEGSKPCRANVSRSLSVKAVPLLRRELLRRSGPVIVVFIMYSKNFLINVGCCYLRHRSDARGTDGFALAGLAGPPGPGAKAGIGVVIPPTAFGACVFIVIC